MITSAQIEDRIKFFLTFLPTDVTEALNTCWHGTGSPLIITDSKTLDENPFGKIEKAGAMLGIHFYNTRTIDESQLDLVILHEMAHDYCFTIKKHDIELYRFGTDKNYRKLGGDLSVWFPPLSAGKPASQSAGLNSN